MNILRASALWASLALLSSLNADLIVYEGFDYSSSLTVDGLNGGSPSGAPGWDSNAWSDVYSGAAQTFDTTGSGLSYSDGFGNDLVTSGVAVIEDEQNNAATNASSIRRTYDTTGTGLGTTGTDAWISYLVDINGSGSHSFQWGSTSGSLTQLQVYRINGGSSTNTWRLHIGGSTDDLLDTDSNYVTASGQFMILINVDYSDGVDPTSVWINPNISSEVALGTPDLFLNTNNVSANNTVTFSAGNFPTSVTYDELRIGTTFRDVAPVPEPGAYSLIFGFAVFSFLVSRRRV